ncbi:MAG: hypothetical protein HY454_02330 [Parcubacteria group bacterium]|nr:hypothetical protein [Parcubacteria group bacterium]
MDRDRIKNIADFSAYLVKVYSRFSVVYLLLLVVVVLETPLAVAGLPVKLAGRCYPGWAGWKGTRRLDRAIPRWITR